MNLDKLREEVYRWSRENFGDQPAEYPLIGVGEEIGELVTSVLKRAQGIDDSEKYSQRDDVGPEAEEDAVADAVIYAADFIERLLNESGDVPKEINDLLDFYYCFGIVCNAVRKGDDDWAEAEILNAIHMLQRFCKHRGYDFNTIVTETWEHVSGREWDSDWVENDD